jgi:hypothetical protein
MQRLPRNENTLSSNSQDDGKTRTAVDTFGPELEKA